jgi:transcriptional regulator with PAS, ATPase and Fis domain
VIPLRLAALRDRIEDLPELARLFVERYRMKFREPVKTICRPGLLLRRFTLGRSNQIPGAMAMTMQRRR